jgi:hypothetical protein
MFAANPTAVAVNEGKKGTLATGRSSQIQRSARITKVIRPRRAPAASQPGEAEAIEAPMARRSTRERKNQTRTAASRMEIAA